jgi:hypothetical protein
MQDQIPAKDIFQDVKPERVWLTLSNVCDKGKFRVVLEVNGVEKELFHSYPNRADGIISESHNLTWLLGVPDGN